MLSVILASVTGLVLPTWTRPRAGIIVAIVTPPPAGFTWGTAAEDEAGQAKKVEALRVIGQRAVKERGEKQKGYLTWVANAEAAAIATAAQELKALQEQGRLAVKVRGERQKGYTDWVAKAKKAEAEAASDAA